MTDPTLPERLDEHLRDGCGLNGHTICDFLHQDIEEAAAALRQLEQERDGWKRSLEEEQTKGAEEIRAIRERSERLLREVSEWQR